MYNAFFKFLADKLAVGTEYSVFLTCFERISHYIIQRCGHDVLQPLLLHTTKKNTL